ncbi:MAG: holo-[acyl-carrier-protein] synthase [SAR202 cluster bacterium]|jgi:holo-[acyl-carrier protein] synthase|nr:holo-ACP synthase [Dehalococcoidia bacterium]MQG26021.1 holo-[acyl-carrier-protein] synthase [SAR202 cluster bacterium]MQG52337.1 holo-[acyl-carrier-protein] synthase [SAR202 cluster bacterium]MQG61100.1 holo-[acyl-carrier-protein] synthase [SAR202 cluster bacterium]CAI8255727.1 MAG: Holo-[acyl-carrier-protein] synthase [Chloroflexota bacterium]|tara:strand:+ start:21021 stop:21395 length:375 start_codon:yes stop_codon:yes gene_type:complete
MPIICTGIDIIEIDRIQNVLSRYGNRFLNKIFTPDEIQYCRGRSPNLAGRFAAKEATMKALKTGARGVSWKDIEVIRASNGAPSIKLYNRALARSESLGVSSLSISFSHSRDYAVASVIASSKE